MTASGEAAEVVHSTDPVASLVVVDQLDFHPAGKHQRKRLARLLHEGITDALELYITGWVNLPEHSCLTVKNDAVFVVIIFGRST